MRAKTEGLVIPELFADLPFRVARRKRDRNRSQDRRSSFAELLPVDLRWDRRD
jgi:hypothetical protein